MTHLITRVLFAFTLALLVPLSLQATPVGTEFSYQGRLLDGSTPANGLFDFQFRLFDQLHAGLQFGGTLTLEDIPVEAGVFSVNLDFGSAFAGEARWLAIAVREGSSVGSFDALSPRQALTAAPYAAYALSGNPGPQGPAGPPGPNGILQLLPLNETMQIIAPGGLNGPWVFASIPTTISIATGQKLVGSVTADFGHGHGNALEATISICQRPAGSGATPVSLEPSANAVLVLVPPGNRTVYPVSLAHLNLPAGSYEVGYCVRNRNGSFAINNTGRVRGWYLVTQ